MKVEQTDRQSTGLMQCANTFNIGMDEPSMSRELINVLGLATLTIILFIKQASLCSLYIIANGNNEKNFILRSSRF